MLSLCAALALACGGQPGTTDSGTGNGSTGATAGETEAGSTTGNPGTTSPGTASATEGTGGQTGGETTGGATTDVTTATTGTTAEPGTTAGGGSSTGAGLCDDFVPPGCIDKGCPDDQVCNTEIECVPSACGCDPATGDVICTADCGGGTCVPACEPLVCDLECKHGFKKDENGCEICECAEEPLGCGCAIDADCTKASPGCCSCNMGGKEVAVAVACLDQLEPCPLPPDQVACPAVYLCTDAQAVCVAGECVLK